MYGAVVRCKADNVERILADVDAHRRNIGEVEALNTTTIRRPIPSARHQLPAIAPV
jgi:hypothetical protein